MQGNLTRKQLQVMIKEKDLTIIGLQGELDGTKQLHEYNLTRHREKVEDLTLALSVKDSKIKELKQELLTIITREKELEKRSKTTEKLENHYQNEINLLKDRNEKIKEFNDKLITMRNETVKKVHKLEGILFIAGAIIFALAIIR